MRIKFVSTATSIKVIVFLAFLFITVGDLFLPEPLKSASTNTKSAMNSFVMGFVPKKKFDNPNDRTEKAVEEFEKGAGAGGNTKSEK